MPAHRLNPNVQGLEPSATLAINERSKALEMEGRTIFRLGLGQSPFPIPERIVESLRHHACEKDYLEVRGLGALRDAVASFHRRVDDVPIRPENVLIGPGSKELLFLLQLVFDGEVLVPTPCWVSYLPQTRILGRRFRTVQMSFEDRWLLTADRLEAACNGPAPAGGRLLVLNYPSNPVGNSLCAGELEALAEVARRHRLIVLSDEIYGQLHFAGAHRSLAHFYPEGTIVSSGLSKWCGAGGWRLGSFAFPPSLTPLAQAMAAVASETYTTVCAPVQYAAVDAFLGGDDLDTFLFHSRRVLHGIGSRCAAILRKAGVRLQEPEGGFYLFLDFSCHRKALTRAGIDDSSTLCERLLERTGVAILPGEAFGRPPTELTARLAFVDFDGSEALRQSAALGPKAELGDDTAEAFGGRTLEAVRRLAAWLQSP